MAKTRNLLPGVISQQAFHALHYGNLIGGLDLSVAKANNQVIAWNTITVGSFLAKAQRRLDFKAEIYDRFVHGAIN